MRIGDNFTMFNIDVGSLDELIKFLPMYCDCCDEKIGNILSSWEEKIVSKSVKKCL